MSGTPIIDNASSKTRGGKRARSNATKAAKRGVCDHIHRLMEFLRHEEFSDHAIWKKKVEKSFLAFAADNPDVRGLALTHLLQNIMVRHTKKDLNLAPPEKHDWWLPSLETVVFPLRNGECGDVVNYNLELTRATLTMARRGEQGISEPLSFTVANFASRVMEVVCRARQRQASGVGDTRPVKAIVFAESMDFLHCIGHFLVCHLQKFAVAEHWGNYRNTELSRFRHDLRSYRTCDVCLGENEGACRHLQQGRCGRTLLVVEYLEPPHPWVITNEEDVSEWGSNVVWGDYLRSGETVHLTGNSTLTEVLAGFFSGLFLLFFSFYWLDFSYCFFFH